MDRLEKIQKKFGQSAGDLKKIQKNSKKLRARL